MNQELCRRICAVNGTSGHENAVSAFILDEIKDYIDDYTINALGSLIAHKKGSGKKMMLAGHMDQIGFLITYVNKEGFLHFTGIGGHTPAKCLSQRVIFPNGTVGVIYSERLDDPKDISMDKLYIDIGAKDEADAKKRVKIGDTCVFYAEPLMDEQKIVSPALDDRIGCYIMIEALKRIKNPAFDLYFVFTVQEEVGAQGARTSAYTIEPDYGIAFDVTFSYDTPKAQKLPAKMYSGAAIKIKDSSLLCHPTIIRHLEKCAEDGGIRYQYEIIEAGGTDSGAIHINKGGVPSGVISIPTRYIHSVSEMCALSDIEDCIQLTVKALETEINEL